MVPTIAYLSLFAFTILQIYDHCQPFIIDKFAFPGRSLLYHSQFSTPALYRIEPIFHSFTSRVSPPLSHQSTAIFSSIFTSQISIAHSTVGILEWNADVAVERYIYSEIKQKHNEVLISWHIGTNQVSLWMYNELDLARLNFGHFTNYKRGFNWCTVHFISFRRFVLDVFETFL